MKYLKLFAGAMGFTAILLLSLSAPAAAQAPAPPTPISPADNGWAPGSEVVFMWNPSSGATWYRLQISKQSNFSSLIIDSFDFGQTITGTSWKYSGLANDGSKYYWRIKAVSSSGGVSSSWVERSFYNSGPPPPTPTLSNPIPNEFVNMTTTIFSWSQPAGAVKYHLQVSKTNNFSSFVVNENNYPTFQYIKSDLPKDGSTFYWRVMALNAAGVGANWSETRMFVNGPPPAEPPPVPGLVNPAQNASVSGTSISFSWNPSPGATIYEHQLSKHADFSVVFLPELAHFLPTQNFSYTNSVTRTHLPNDGTTIYWRVRAGTGGQWSAWSSSRGFVNGAAPPPPPPPSPLPAPPALVSPAPNLQLVQPGTQPITFNWNPSAGATRYHIQVSRHSNFQNYDSADNSLTATSHIMPSSAQTTYYWRVRAGNAADWGNWSDVRSFSRVNPPPPVPEPVSPGGRINVPGTAITFNWNPSAGATRYHLQVSTSRNFKDSLLFNNEDIAAAQMAVPGFSDNGTTFYWRVRAYNQAGGWSEWSGGSNPSFFVNGTASIPPLAPMLSSPDHGAAVSRASVALNWRPIKGAVKYHLQVSSSPSFSTVFFENSDIHATSQTVGNFPDAPARIYWRVRACNAEGMWGDWSETRMFHIN